MPLLFEITWQIWVRKGLGEIVLRNHDYKLLVLDIDGTLLGKDGTISDKDREALARVSGSGIRVALSTGRVVQACLKIINQLSLDGEHMFFDGALVYDPGKNKEVYVKPIDEQVLQQAIDFTHANDIYFELYSATRYFTERKTWATKVRGDYFNIFPIVVNFNEVWNKERIIKGSLPVATPEEKAKAMSFYRQFDGSLSLSWTTSPAYPGIDFINVIAPGVSKGNALEALISYLGISLAEVMAIGDGVNDIPLLSLAGLAVAMEDAPEEVRAVADDITLDVAHSGLATAIEKYLL
jgi:Cof subfamily protein (haloacid dehalogenase superfamily)